jgi:DNA-binding HxlR family transcriptional regulator
MTKENCTNAFSILGKKWNGEIIDILLNANEPLRFKELAGEVKACSQKVLTERLKELEAIGIIERITIENSNRVNYLLTDKGQAMNGFMNSINSWADEYLSVEGN